MIKYSEIRSKGRKWVVSNFWSNVWEFWYEGRFSGAWNSDNSNISYEFEFKIEIFDFRDISELSKCWSLTSRASEVSISVSSTSSLRHQNLFSVCIEIHKQLSTIFVSHECSYRDFYDEIFSVSSVTEVWHSSFSIFSSEYFFMTKFWEGIEVFIGDKVYVSTISTVSSPWSSFWDIFFTTPWNKAVSSFSWYYLNMYFVYKHGSLVKK